jgi:hypothetical protein
MAFPFPLKKIKPAPVGQLFRLLQEHEKQRGKISPTRGRIDLQRSIFLKSPEIPLQPLFSKRKKSAYFSKAFKRDLLPSKKGGREGFLRRHFQDAK